MPAELSFPIPSGLTRLRDADPLQQAETPHLLAYLATIPDPRAPRGRRHPLIAILTYEPVRDAERESDCASPQDKRAAALRQAGIRESA